MKRLYLLTLLGTMMIFGLPSTSSSRIYVNLKFVNYGFVVAGSTWDDDTGELKFELVKRIGITQSSGPYKLYISFPEGKYTDKNIDSIIFAIRTNDALTNAYEPNFAQGLDKNRKYAVWDISVPEFLLMLETEEVTLKITFQGSDSPLMLVLPKAMLEEWKYFLDISFEV